MKTAHILFTASLAFAMAFTLSCSSSSDDPDPSNGGGSSGPRTETYSYTKTGDSFTIIAKGEEYKCRTGGNLELDSYDAAYNYSISNNVLAFWLQWDSELDAIEFSGTSNDLVGTWTRTKNKNASCKINEYYPNSMDCKEGWDIVKAEFTASEAKLTRDYCRTDRIVEDVEDRYDGTKRRIIDCNTYKMYKGAEEVTVKETATGSELTHNGKTCSFKWSNSLSRTQLENACRDASSKQQAEGGSIEDHFDEAINPGSQKCIENFPEWFSW